MFRRPWYIVAIVGVLLGTCLYFILSRPSQPTVQRQPTTKAPVAANPATKTTVLASYVPPTTNGLITNEFTYWNKGDPSAKTSPDWQMTSGSLYATEGVFWTGKPDSCNKIPDGPNAVSSNCTDSDIFRLNSTKTFSGSIAVSVVIKQNADIHDANCNAHNSCWNGTHLWLRYINQYNLYYVSVNRADGQVVIKRKVPCGPSNSGTYFVLGSYIHHDFKTGVWNSYTATIHTNTNGSVTLQLYDGNSNKTKPVVTGTDHGGINPNWSPKCTVAGHYDSANYQPITMPGDIGVRGDYANFEFKQLQVTSL